MYLALLRHGIAEEHADSDFDRALTPGGRIELAAVVDDLALQGWRPGAIVHSPLVRTTQTAEIVAARFPAAHVRSANSLAQGHLDGMLMAAAGLRDPLLVGHEPSLGMLAARLIGGDLGGIAFERAGFALFMVDGVPPRRPGRLVLFQPPRREGRLGR